MSIVQKLWNTELVPKLETALLEGKNGRGKGRKKGTLAWNRFNCKRGKKTLNEDSLNEIDSLSLSSPLPPWEVHHWEVQDWHYSPQSSGSQTLSHWSAICPRCFFLMVPVGHLSFTHHLLILTTLLLWKTHLRGHTQDTSSCPLDRTFTTWPQWITKEDGKCNLYSREPWAQIKISGFCY